MLLLPIHSLGHNNMAADDNMVVNSMAGDKVVDMVVVSSRHFEHNTSHFPIQLFALLILRMQSKSKIVDVEQYRYA